jgi:hypothetical protein
MPRKTVRKSSQPKSKQLDNTNKEKPSLKQSKSGDLSPSNTIESEQSISSDKVNKSLTKTAISAKKLSKSPLNEKDENSGSVDLNKSPKSPNLKIPPSWLNEKSKSYKPWARPSVEGEKYVFCIWCKKHILVSSVAGTKGHLQMLCHKSKQDQWDIDHPKQSIDVELTETAETKQTKLFDIEFCNLLITLNLPFIDVECILNFIKKHSKNNYVKESKLNRIKASDIVNNEIQAYFVHDLKQRMYQNYFSIIIDEATDICKQKHLAILVQMWDDMEGIVCKLLCVKECSIDSSAAALYKILEEEIIGENYAKNLIGLVTDGAPVMNGSYNSIKSRLDKDYPDLWYLWCVCHCLNLAAIKATDTLPEDIDQFARKAFSSINSPKKISEFSNLVAGNCKKLLKPANTRWLTVQAANERILLLWEPLKQILTSNNESELLSIMNQPETKVYIQFLSVFL